MTEPILVETDAALDEVQGALRDASIASFDAEGPGQGAFPDRLCLLVVAAGTRVFVVDPLAVDPLPLAGELGRTDRPLIVHDVAYDARLLTLAKLSLGLVHDTSVAATMLGKPKTGLASLASELLGLTLDKSLQASAWSRRPLDARSMRYLAADAQVPFDLHRALWPALEAADLVDETLTETQHRIRRAEEAITESAVPAWWKLAGARALPTRERQWLRAAWIARDRVARGKDRSPALILTDDELQSLARPAPRGIDELRSRLGRRAADASLLTALVDALARADEPVPDRELERLDAPVPSAAERERAKQLRKRLVAWRTSEARARGVGESAVLPGHLADRLASDPSCLHNGPDALPAMGRRRFDRYADTLRQLLEVR
jgi:ribonuclease D